jgi:tetratricopeptide (TPR) repeat protein
LLEKAIRINAKNDLAWRELSIPYLYAGLLEEWNRYSDKAVQLNPEAWQGWRGYNRLYFFRDYAGALFDLDATDTLTKNQIDYPQNISVDYLRGLCYMGLKDYRKSIEYFEKFVDDESIKLDPPFVEETAFLYMGIIANREGRFQDAITLFERGLMYEEGYADFNFHMAESFCFLGDVQNATKQIEIAKIKFNDNKYMRRYQGEAIEQIYLSDIDALDEQISYSG